jgi:5,10-methenyltetrahydrofolate synthetase
MSDNPDDEEPVEYASPPCLLSEIDPAYSGLDMPAARPADIAAWRKSERERLIAARMALSQEERHSLGTAIAARLDQVAGPVAGKKISLYWPFRGEPDLRGWMETVDARGGTCLLPLVVAKGQPLKFRAWKAGDPLERGVWNIPYPAKGPDAAPDIVIAPLVGFDPGCYRLGYGGGFFDRTLAGLAARPLIIGVGHDIQKIATIHPLPHDIPMDVIITGSRTIRRT